MAHGVFKVMALHKVPIWLCTSPLFLSTSHVRAYVALRDGEPSGTQSLTPDREEVSQPSSSNPHPDGSTPISFR